MGTSSAFVLAWQIIEALDYLHQHDIVHGDITLSNVLLVAETALQIKLADFSPSRLVRSKHEKELLFKFRKPLGTPEYMAPELIRHALAGAPSESPGDATGGDDVSDTDSEESFVAPVTAKPRIKDGYFDASIDVWATGIVRHWPWRPTWP